MHVNISIFYNPFLIKLDFYPLFLGPFILSWKLSYLFGSDNGFFQLQWRGLHIIKYVIYSAMMVQFHL